MKGDQQEKKFKVNLQIPQLVITFSMNRFHVIGNKLHYLNIHLNYVYNCKFLQYMIKKIAGF